MSAIFCMYGEGWADMIVGCVLNKISRNGVGERD
jgi:hypothetical protein